MKICKIGIPNWLLIPVNSFLPLESKKNIFGDTGGWGGGGCSQIPTTLPPASLIIILELQAFLDFRGFDFCGFLFTGVYDSIIFSSPLVLLSNLYLRGFCFRGFLFVSQH